MKLRYAGICRTYGVAVAVGQPACYDRAAKAIECILCAEGASAEAVPLATGTAGVSARREYERRAGKRKERIRSAHPRLGGLIMALTDEPQRTRAWERGAVGEEKLARSLDSLVQRGARTLHDRRIPRSVANIDHLLIAPAGVFVIDAKRYAGRPELKVEGGLLRPRTETLLVGGRDRTKLVAGVHKQVGVVRGILGTTEVSVRGMLCFVDADWPMFGGNFTIDGVDVLWPGKIADRAFHQNVLTPEQIDEMTRRLAGALRPA